MNRKHVKLGTALIALGFLSAYSLEAQSREGRRENRTPPTIEQLFEDLDANEDGKLSSKEVKGPLKKDFAKIDANEDGYLSWEELEKAPKPERNGPPKRE
ncbi:EF-hand domain-containing protein [Ulvibacterium marinum]|uniref:EF-hand domain-containing protein n=1 Tax=Ulvibacterium marinum TaxID=2419782 RepID=UPI002494D695|nr:EF-hand domain-containing protein [Ulvibacterium marinum]